MQIVTVVIKAQIEEAHDSIRRFPDLKLKQVSSASIREFDFVFVESRPVRIKLDLNHDTGVTWVQVSKPRKDNDSIANLKLVHCNRRRPAGRSLNRSVAST